MDSCVSITLHSHSEFKKNENSRRSVISLLKNYKRKTLSKNSDTNLV